MKSRNASEYPLNRFDFVFILNLHSSLFALEELVLTLNAILDWLVWVALDTVIGGELI